MKNEDIKTLENLPETLKNTGAFCLWRYEKDKRGRQTKVPYNPHRPKDHAQVDTPETFADFVTTCNKASSSDFDGIGTRVCENLTGVDIDHCFDDDGVMSETARDIVETLNAYTELSPSGKGLHLYFTAPRVDFTKERYYIKHGDIEVYIDGKTNRYLTVTGRTIRPGDIVDRSDELQAVLNKYMVRPATKTSSNTREGVKTALSLSENEIIQLAREARNGRKFEDLYIGNWETYYTSQSEADMGLCSILAFYTQDESTIDAIFRCSGLYRAKWDREDYGPVTIRKAIAFQSEHYTPPGNDRPLDWDGTINSAGEYEEYYKDDPGAVDPMTGESENAPASEPVPEPTPDDILDEFFKEVQTERFKPISTGIRSLDKALSGGLERKTIVTLASAPGAGKTAFCQYMFENMARNGHDVVYVNLEMDRSQLLSRSISRIIFERRVPPVKTSSKTWEQTAKEITEDVTSLVVRRGYEWTDYQREKITKAVEIYRQEIAPRFHYVTANPENTGHTTTNLTDIMDKLERITNAIKAEGRPEPLVCVDYLQYIKNDRKTEDGHRRDTAEAIADILATFKSFAMSHSTVVLLIMANNRTSNKEGRASMDSGRDTSNIEYTGDTMLSLTYTAIEDMWRAPELNEDGTEKKDKDGNTKYKTFDLDMINMRADMCAENDTESTIQKKVCVKVVKGRGIKARKSARFIFDGAHASYTEDPEPVEFGKKLKLSTETRERIENDALKRARQLPPT